MTTANTHRLPSIPHDVQGIITAALELREAKQMLRQGNVVKGVQRYENAKKALYHAMNSVNGTTIVIPRENLTRALNDHSHSEQVSRILQAATEFTGAFEAYRASGSGNHAALALARAEKNLIRELDELHRHN